MTTTLPSDAVIAALQLELAVLCEELEALAVAPMRRTSGKADVPAMLASVGRDIAALAQACEVLERRSALREQELD